MKRGPGETNIQTEEVQRQSHVYVRTVLNNTKIFLLRNLLGISRHNFSIFKNLSEDASRIKIL